VKSSKSVELRRNNIVAHVNQHGHTQVETLASQFNTSVVTIRKDLAALAEQGKLIRQFGGAVPALDYTKSAITEGDATENVHQKTTALSPIGKAAAGLIKSGHKLVIDCGSTTASLLPFLSDKKNLVVMTNALATANFLTRCETEPTVLMTGGTWDAQSQSFQGAMAEQLVSAYNFDLAFIGAAGIDVNRGTTTFNELTGVTRAMASAASKVVVMASSTKLNHKMPNLELGWSQISVLITDEGIRDEDKQKIENQGVAVIIAPQNGE